MNGLFIIFIIYILTTNLDASNAPGHLYRRQNNNTVNPASTTASGILCPTTPVTFTTTVNSSAPTTVSTITDSTTSFVTITGQPIPSAITTTLPAIDFNQPLRTRNETIPYQAYHVASDYKSITSKQGFSNCGGIVDIDDFRILYSASKKTFIPFFRGRSPVVVNNATARVYVQIYGTSTALEFNGIPCFGAKNASPCTSDNVIDSGSTFDASIAQYIGSFLIKYGYFSLIESLGGYAILTVQTGDNDPYLACAVTKVADDDNMADSLVSPSAATAYTATSAAVGLVCLTLAAGGVVTVATVGTDSPPENGYQKEALESTYVDQAEKGNTLVDMSSEGGKGFEITPEGGGDVGGGSSGIPPAQGGGETGAVPGVGDHQATSAPSHVQYPSFYDFIFYTQSIITTGWLSLNLTSEYRKFTSTFSWACAQGFINLNVLASAANNLRYSICGIIVNKNMNAILVPGTCVDSENGYKLPPVGSNSSLTFGTNSSPSTPQATKHLYGFDSYAHIIGVPVEDLPFASMIGFLVVMGIAITLVLLGAIVASIVIKCRQNAPVFWMTMRNNVHLFIFGMLKKILFEKY
ncbi:5935_t:CDS:2 [Cetraspora pellucida]|uniref:5935_t:CDS:1 n=1 Tax=Cetraspora pellucida TaxID=1433469 RepID=A0A9N9FY34_9GLOM|nr:5935_t:CDS:2 [Cetraspora pellucida]